MKKRKDSQSNFILFEKKKNGVLSEATVKSLLTASYALPRPMCKSPNCILSNVFELMNI